jgi:hypothetical protein
MTSEHGTRDDEQRERAVQPRVEVAAERDRDDDERRGAGDDQRGVDAREAIDEPLGGRAAALRLLDQLGHPRERRRGGLARDPDLEGAGDVERAGEHLVAGELVDRDGLAGDRRLVDARRAADHDAVEREPLARAHAEALPGGHRAHVDQALGAVVADDPRLRRGELHQRAHGSAAAVEGQGLQRGADGEEHEHPRALGVLADGHRAQRRKRHEDVHVERSASQRPDGRPGDGPAAHGDRREVQAGGGRGAGQRGDDAEEEDRDGEHGRHGARLAPPRGRGVVAHDASAVAGLPDRRGDHRGLDAALHDQRAGAERHGGLVDALQREHALLDRARAAAAVHPLDAKALDGRGHQLRPGRPPSAGRRRRRRRPARGPPPRRRAARPGRRPSCRTPRGRAARGRRGPQPARQRRCLETLGCESPVCSTTSDTRCSPDRRHSRIRTRDASDSPWKKWATSAGSAETATDAMTDI